MTPERIEELVSQALAYDAVSDPRGQIESTIRQAIKEASAVPEGGVAFNAHEVRLGALGDACIAVTKVLHSPYTRQKAVDAIRALQQLPQHGEQRKGESNG